MLIVGKSAEKLPDDLDVLVVDWNQKPFLAIAVKIF